MPTRKEKIEELKSRVDPNLVDELLSGAESTEDGADAAGIESKEFVALKAKKKIMDQANQADKMDEEEAEGEDESAEDPEEEAGETPEEENAEEDEEGYEPAPKGKKKEFEGIGNLSLEDFADLVSGALAASLDPYLAAVKEVGSAVEGLRTDVDTITARMGKRVKEARTLEARLTSIEKVLKELEGDMPSALKGGYEASKDTGTIITDEAKLKELGAGPQPDSTFQDFYNFLKS